MSAKSLRLTCPECRWFAETRELPNDEALDAARAQLAAHLGSEHAYAQDEADELAHRVAWRPANTLGG